MDNQFTEEQKAKWLNDLYEKHPALAKSGSEFGAAIQREITSSKAQRSQSELDAIKKIKQAQGLPTHKVEPTKTQKQQVIDYAEKVRNSLTPSQVRYIQPSKEMNLMDLKEAKVKLWAIMAESLTGQKKNLVLDGNSKKVINELLMYFIRDERCPLDLDKGINIFGYVGVGKSWLMQMFSKFTTRCKLETAFKIHKMRSIVLEIREKKDLSMSPFLHGSICYDDVGFEPLQVKIYGDSDSVFTTIIDEQYEKFKKSGKIIHMTSNLQPEGTGETIKSKYAVRVADRCNEMFNNIYLIGKSKRQ